MPFGFLKLLIQIISLLKSVYTTAGIDQLLLTSKERMALGADFNTDLALSGAGLKSVAAGALYYSFIVIGMDPFLHEYHLFFDFILRYFRILSYFDCKIKHFFQNI